MQEDSTRCREILELLSDYIDGDCAPPVRALVESHLADCANCLAFLNTLKKSVEMTRELSCDEIPDEVRLRLHRLLQRTIPIEPPPSEVHPPPRDRGRDVWTEREAEE